MSKHVLPTAALLGLVSGNVNANTILLPPTTYTASTQNPSPPGSTGLGPYNPIASPTGVGGIGGPISTCGTAASPTPCVAPTPGTLRMTVQDEEFTDAGNVFEAFVDGFSIGFTSGVSLFNTTPVNCTVPPGFGMPPQSTFSCGIFDVVLPAGPFTFDINDQILSYTGFPSPYDPTGPDVPGSFSPGGVMVTLEFIPGEVSVPEPTMLEVFIGWLLGLGLIGLGALRRRKTG